MPFPLKLAPDLPGAVHTVILFPYTPYLHTQSLIALLPIRQPSRVHFPGLVLVIRRWGDRQLLADRLDPKSLPVFVDEGHHLAG